jgi:hypothetical protein
VQRFVLGTHDGRIGNESGLTAKPRGRECDQYHNFEWVTTKKRLTNLMYGGTVTRPIEPFLEVLYSTLRACLSSRLGLKPGADLS